MGYYINDIVTFSNKGFEKIDFNFIESPENAEITDYNSRHLQGKGLRFVPRTIRMLHNVVGEILEKNGLNAEKNMTGIYNTNDICALEPSIDFDLEVENYGVKLANPMKIPYTLNGSTAGWLAIRSRMNNVNLSVNSGRCSILAAFNLTSLDFMDKETSHAIILCAHYMGERYKKYNQDSTFNKEIAVGMLASEKKTDTSIIEVLECRTMSYNKKKLEEIVDLQTGYTFIDTDFYINLQNHGQLQFFQSTSPQLSCLPFFINNMDLFLPENKGQEHQYIIIDKKGFMGYMKFKRPQP